MKVTTVITIHLDRDEEIPYTVDGDTFRISSVASVDGRRPLIYSRRVFADGRVTHGTLRYHDLPPDVVEQVGQRIAAAREAGVRS